jgi:hypothetical protein
VHAVAPALADSDLVAGPGCKIGRARARHGSLAPVNHTEVVHLAPAEEAGAEQTDEIPLCESLGFAALGAAMMAILAGAERSAAYPAAGRPPA